MGVVYPSQAPDSNFISRLTNSTSSTNIALQTLVIFGFLSMTFSTIDAVIMTVTLFYNDNIENKDSTDKQVNPSSVNKVRIKTILFISITMLFLGFFNYNQPNLYYLLLGIAGPIAVFTPLIYLSGKLSREDKLAKLSNARTWVFFILFIISHLIYFAGIAFKEQVVTSYTSITAFIISGLFAIYIYNE